MYKIVLQALATGLLEEDKKKEEKMEKSGTQ